MKELLFDFGARYKAGEVDDPDQYFRLLEDAKAERLFMEAATRRSDFDGIKESLDEYMQNLQEKPDTRADLKAYIETIVDYPKSVQQIVAEMEKTEHAAFIKDICKFLILSPENKTNTIFMYGAPNSGKTQFLNRLNEIFKIVYYKQTRSNFDCKYKNGKIAPHFVILEEGAFEKFFNSRD